MSSNAKSKEKYLTKSKFILGISCPTKLYYHNNSDRYTNKSLDNPFLEALAKGGFQVGALARAYYPEGILIEETSHELAVLHTNELLKSSSCIIFEAAVKAENCFIRVDILIKNGDILELIEVKAKSYNPATDTLFDKKGEVASTWKPYIADIAFQQMVLRKAFPKFALRSFFMLADKSQVATVNGLNQQFRLEHIKNRIKVITNENLSVEDLGKFILIKVAAGEAIEKIKDTQFDVDGQSIDFENYASLLADSLQINKKLAKGIGRHCKGCEFDNLENPAFSGFRACWKQFANLTDAQFLKPSLFELWRGRLGSKDIISPLFERQDYFLTDFTEGDYISKTLKPTVGFSSFDRRNIQVQKFKNADTSAEYHYDFLKAQFASFIYPLHFIDFETTALAIPMYIGIKPYEQIAFQFSHHTVSEDGTVTHADQWLNDEVGEFPNFNFVRALKKALETDSGSIFRYHNHENSILNSIYDQLIQSTEPDAAELCAFIQTITHRKSEWVGERDMIDLYELVLGGFYHPMMKGSNSIKDVLPAIINSSNFIQQKYILPISSLNFNNHVWLQKDEVGNWISPYKTLPKIFEGVSDEELDQFNFDVKEQLSDGGAAMMTYAKMQFTEMAPQERAFYHNALLKYCELDTLAMVMIYEAWREEIRKS